MSGQMPALGEGGADGGMDDQDDYGAVDDYAEGDNSGDPLAAFNLQPQVRQ